jgi:hypothetical protein
MKFKKFTEVVEKWSEANNEFDLKTETSMKILYQGLFNAEEEEKEIIGIQ